MHHIKMTLSLPALLCLSVLLACGPSPAVDYTAWMHPYLVPLERGEVPPQEPSTVISLQTTPGEYEPAAFAVRADKALSVSVALDGGTLPSDWMQIDRVESRTDSTALNRLYPVDGPVPLDSAQTRFFWLTVRPPEDTPAGDYSCTIAVTSGNQRATLTVDCRILPFKLAESGIVDGTFMCLADLPDGWYGDMKGHGMDAIQFFTWEWSVRDTTMLARRGEWAEEPIAITRRGDDMVLDFSAFDRMMKQINDAGMTGPVVISLGNDRLMHYEIRIANVMGLPVDTTVAPTPKGWKSRTITFVGPPLSPRLDSLFIDGLRQLHEHWAQQGWPQEMIILIYDEPTHGLLARGLQRYKLIKKYFPGTRIYGVVMDKRELAVQVAPQCDILVANGDFDGVRAVADSLGKDFYVYGSMGGVNYGRFRMGCMPWRTRASGAFFWMYNYWFYSPDGCAVYQDQADWTKLVRSVNWEGIREGADDLRYFATAERKIARLPADRRDAASARLEQVRASINPGYRGRPRKDEHPGESELLEMYLLPQRIRQRVIEIILSLE